jgi:hypothetical protein
MRFEEKYEDVLQNLEFGIMEVYHEHPEMTDYDVMAALEALRRHYIREARKQEPITFDHLSDREQKLFDSVELMCEWRMGRAQMTTEDGAPLEMGKLVLTVNEIIDCIKRIERSVQRWNKHGGRQGYLKFVAQFFPE